MAEKTVHNRIASALRSVTRGYSLPQKKAVKDILIGLMRHKTPIINHLTNTKKSVTVKKQSERLLRHLGVLELKKRVEERILKTLPEVEADTIIAYDLSDIAKPKAKKMEGLHKVFDGSERKPSIGYTLHGVSVANQPVVMEIHDHEKHTQNQTRLSIIDRVKAKIGTNGIWVFDRGNDDQQFFEALEKKELRFVVRAKSNRNLIKKETGETKKITEFLAGVHEVIIPETKQMLYLIVQYQKGRTQPIRVFTNVEKTSAAKIIDTYLARWEVENLFKQLKTVYKLESIRVLSLQKMTNLLALVQLTLSISNNLFSQSEAQKTSHLSLLFSHYCAYRSLSRNRFSFSCFLSSITPQITTPTSRSSLPSLFSWRQLGKLGVF